MTDVIRAYGCLIPLQELSDVLTQLRVGHMIIDRNRRETVHAGHQQPAWPILLPNVGMIKRYRSNKKRQVLFVCDSLSALRTCNVDILKPDNMDLRVREALLYAIANPVVGWSLVDKAMSFPEFVAYATKPSFLNDLQAEFYSINPYPLRVEVRALVLEHLANVVSRKKLLAKLDTSHKLGKLRLLADDPKCEALRSAVARVQRGENEQTVAAATGFEPFELLYVVKASAKNGDKK